jgi:hypothetical protein
VKYGTFLILIITGCTASSPNEVEISSFVQGLMRKNANGAWRVYEQGSEFRYHINGRCSADNILYDCMWYGIEFDFQSPAETTLLKCFAQMSGPTDIFTYKAQEAKAVSEFQFELTLSGREGHMSNPAYTIGESRGLTQVTCSHSEKIVLRYDFNILN